MSKYIVVVFDDEQSVYKGALALQELDNDASITLYEGAVVAKDTQGKVRVIDAEEEGPIGVLAGMLLGSLIGVIGGPVGMAVGAAGYVFRPEDAAGVSDAIASAQSVGVPLAVRGAGCSYGDAAFVPEGVVLDLTRMNRILAWDPETGVADVEPGVTVEQLWRHCLADGWWPPVVTGTMEPTIGGALAMNVHGKNNWQRGTLGEHCLTALYGWVARVECKHNCGYERFICIVS